MLQAILETLQDYSLTNSLKDVNEIMSEKEQEVCKVVEDYLANSPIMTSKDLQELLGVSPATARRYLFGFVQRDYWRYRAQRKVSPISLPKTNQKGATHDHNRHYR